MDKVQKAAPNLSIIIPALNEAATIAETLQKIQSFMMQRMPNTTYELIVVAAKDKDDTAAIARQQIGIFAPHQLHVITPNGRVGKGRDVALGFAAATGVVQLFTDADLAIPLSNIPKAYKLLQTQLASGADAAVFAVRSQKHNSPVRKVISICGSLVTRALFFTNITDLQCGFKAFTAGAATKSFRNLRTKGWMFDVEVFKKLKAAKISVIPLAIEKWESDAHHLGGENLLKASISAFIEMLKIRFSK